jgi:hypothetical protein
MKNVFILIGFVVSTLSCIPVRSVAEPNEAVITLERTTCYGSCPSYKISIRKNGDINFEGKQYVRVKGSANSKIEPAAVDALIKEFMKIDYFSLEDEYTRIKNRDGTVSIVTDLPTTITSINHSGKHKEIVDYVGAPPQLRELERTIDRVANTKRWVSIDAETLHEKCRHGWNVNGKEARGLFKLAASAGDAGVVRAFIEEGANVKKPVNSGPLFAVARGREVFELLISAGAEINGQPGNLLPPILRAAKLGETDSLTVLLKAGARVDIEDSDGTTALMMAAESGVPASVKLLLSAGADPSKKDRFGETALDYARHAEEQNAAEETHPGPFGGPIPDFRMKFEEIKRLLASPQHSKVPD